MKYQNNEAQLGGRRPRVMSTFGRRLAVVMAVVVTFAGLAASTTSVLSSSAAGAATSPVTATPCAVSGYACTVTLPCPTQIGTAPTDCPSTPTIEAEAVTDLTNGEYVKVTATGFPSTASDDSTGTVQGLTLALCAASDADASDPNCLYGYYQGSQTPYTAATTPILPNTTTDNKTVATYPVFFDPNADDNAPLPSRDFYGNASTSGSLFCDNTANPCVLIASWQQDPSSSTNPTGVNPSNSVAIPLSYADQSNGCPSSDPQLFTASSYSLDQFIPTSLAATCASSKGVVALNTATNNLNVAQDIAGGSATIGFIDNPGDPAERAALGNASYNYIPIAVSATAEGFLGSIKNGLEIYPVANYNLTPNLVAGLLTGAYSGPESGDNLVSVINPDGSQGTPSLQGGSISANALCRELTYQVANQSGTGTSWATCPANTPLQSQVCSLGIVTGACNLSYQQQSFAQAFSAVNLLNPDLAGLVTQTTPVTDLTTIAQGPAQFGLANPSVSSGSSYQATSWICQAPNVAFPVSYNVLAGGNPKAPPITVHTSVVDDNLASTTLTTAPTGSSVWPPPSTPIPITNIAIGNGPLVTAEGTWTSGEKVSIQGFGASTLGGLPDGTYTIAQGGSGQFSLGSSVTTTGTFPTSVQGYATDASAPAWLIPTCKGTSSLPALASNTTFYSPTEDPASQVKAIRNLVNNGGVVPQAGPGGQPVASFGLMDSSQAAFYGLNDASLQNPAGQFVPPTSGANGSIEAAVSNAQAVTACSASDTDCPLGTYKINYAADTNPAAYVMPDITYAVVPAAAQTPAVASAITNLLTNLVTYSHSGQLPNGYAPLPTSMYTAALSEIGKDVAVQPAASTSTSSSSSTTSSSSSDFSSSDLAFTSTGLDSGLDTSSLPLTGSTTSTPAASSSGSGAAAVATPSYPAEMVAASGSRMLLPGALAALILCLIVGPALLLLSRRRGGV